MEQQTQKTHFKVLANPNYIGAYTLMDGTDGKELVVTVSKVVRETVNGPDGKSEQCTVAHLVGQKPFILNATNQKIMAKVFGSPYIEDWTGKSMTLYVAKVKAFGDTVEALRVRPTAPKMEQAKTKQMEELTPGHPKWDGAIKALSGGKTTLEAVVKAYIVSPNDYKTLNDAVPVV